MSEPGRGRASGPNIAVTGLVGCWLALAASRVKKRYCPAANRTEEKRVKSKDTALPKVLVQKKQNCPFLPNSYDPFISQCMRCRVVTHLVGVLQCELRLGEKLHESCVPAEESGGVRA